MNEITTILLAVRRQIDSPGLRYLPRALFGGAAIGALVLVAWLPAKKVQLNEREVAVTKHLKAIQDDLAEIERLKMRKPPSEVPLNTVQEALSASLANVSPTFSITAIDADHLRVQGAGDFDALVRWLGVAQAGHRISATRMSVIRQKEDVVVDITLSSHRQ